MPKIVICVASFNGSFSANNFKDLPDDLELMVVNQFTKIDGMLDEEASSFEIYNVDEIGLSRSRNYALNRANGRHIIFCDDDIQIVSSELACFLKFARKYLEKYSFITFNNAHSSGPSRDLHKHNRFTIMKVPSWTILVNAVVAADHNIRFDNRFGIGAEYGSGEENIYLYDLIQASHSGLHLDLKPVIHSDISTGFIWSQNLIRTKGAVFKRTYGGMLGFFITIIFLIKKMRFIDRKMEALQIAVREYFKFKP